MAKYRKLGLALTCQRVKWPLRFKCSVLQVVFAIGVYLCSLLLIFARRVMVKKNFEFRKSEFLDTR